MKKRIFLVILILIITVINIILFAKFYYDKIENNSIQIKTENTNF